MGCKVIGGCCGENEKYKSDYHDFDQCPKIGEPCGGDPYASCSGLTVQGTLESDEFCAECFENFTPKVSCYFSADNFGYVQGDGSKLSCPNGGDQCTTCYIEGILTPQVIAVPGKNFKYKKMKISYFGQNSPHGGPYGIGLVAYFYFEDPNG
jgi:hypothetical protein